MAKANKQQLARIKSKQREFARLKRDAELAIANARAAEQAFKNTVSDVIEECGLDPSAPGGWTIGDDGEIKLVPTKAPEPTNGKAQIPNARPHVAAK